MCGMELLIHSRTSLVPLLKFGSGQVISPHHNGCNNLSLLGLNSNHVSKMDSWTSYQNTAKWQIICMLHGAYHIIVWLTCPIRGSVSTINSIPSCNFTFRFWVIKNIWSARDVSVQTRHRTYNRRVWYTSPTDRHCYSYLGRTSVLQRKNTLS